MYRISKAILVAVFLVSTIGVSFAGGCGGCGMASMNHEGHDMDMSGDKHAQMDMKMDSGKTATYEALPEGLKAANVYFLANGEERFVDPVSGEHAFVKDAASHHDMDGKRFYLAKSTSMDVFMSDMNKYTEAMIIPANVVLVDGKSEMIKCPVTREEAPLGKNLKFTDYNGKRFYFCCADCQKPFEKKPAKYAK